jgi:hypothetical protein
MHSLRSFVALSVSAPLALLVFAAACGGAAPAPAEPTGPSSTSAAASSATPEQPVPATWSKDLSQPQQVAFMKTRVMPSMKPVFQAQDATRYAEFSCTTCHGPEFKDPHEALPHLTLQGGKLTAFAEKPDISKFMAEKVVPNMATAMGEPPFDLKTGQGFGCAGCHTIDKK